MDSYWVATGSIERTDAPHDYALLRVFSTLEILQAKIHERIGFDLEWVPDPEEWSQAFESHLAVFGTVKIRVRLLMLNNASELFLDGASA